MKHKKKACTCKPFYEVERSAFHAARSSGNGVSKKSSGVIFKAASNRFNVPFLGGCLAFSILQIVSALIFFPFASMVNALNASWDKSRRVRQNLSFLPISCVSILLSSSPFNCLDTLLYGEEWGKIKRVSSPVFLLTKPEQRLYNYIMTKKSTAPNFPTRRGAQLTVD
jgi:hypothetical protein